MAIFPEYNPTSIHADIFIPIRPGTDSALALGMANYIINKRLYDEVYIKQYTDMPMLIRMDNKKFLRESDMILNGSPEKFYIWDQNTGKPAIAPGTQGFLGSQDWTLNLGPINPALEGVFTVHTISGQIQVTPVFSLLKQKIAVYDPVTVSGITGVEDYLVEQIAREFASTKPARIIGGAGESLLS